MIGEPLLLAALNWHSVFFYLFAAIACAFGAGVLLSANVVRMAFYLIISLASTAGLFFLAGAEFLGAMQIMIYVGGTLVLLIFGVMLTAQEAFVNMKTHGGEWIMGLIVGASLLLLLVTTAFRVDSWKEPHPELVAYTKSVKAAEEVAGDPSATDEQVEEAWDNVHQPEFPRAEAKTAQMGFAFVGPRVDEAATPQLQRGQSGYWLAFQAVGVHLLIVLVGAAYLSRTTKVVAGRARAASPVERVRTRGSALAAFIVMGEIGNLIAAVVTIAGQQRLLDEYPHLFLDPPQWLFPVVSLLFLGNVLALAVVWGWQRWGLAALFVIPVVQGVLLATNGVDGRIAGAVVVVQLLGVALLAALLFSGKPSGWSQMD